MDSSLVPLFEKLSVEHTSIRRFTVRAIFSQLRSQPQDLSIVVRQLLSNSSAVVVDEAIAHIITLVESGTIPVEDIINDLLASLPTAGNSCIRPLVAGLGQIMSWCMKDANAPDVFAKWRRGATHPLTKVLQGQPAAQENVLVLVDELLRLPARGRVSPAVVLSTLSPFVVFLLLESPPPASRSAFPCLLHAHLVRRTCDCSSTQMRHLLLDLLTRALHYQPARDRPASEPGRPWLMQAAGDLIDAFEVGESPDEKLYGMLLDTLVHVCHEARSCGGTLIAVLRLIQRLTFPRRALLHTHMLSFAALLETAACREEAEMLLAVMAMGLWAGGAPGGAGAEYQLQGAQLVLPLLQGRRKLWVLMSAGVKVGYFECERLWEGEGEGGSFGQALSLPEASARKVRTLLQATRGAGESAAGGASDLPRGAHGRQRMLAASEDVLHRLWHRPEDAIGWLHRVRQTLLPAPAAAAASKVAAPKQGIGSEVWADVSRVVGTLLLHSDAAVVVAAAAAIEQMAETSPLGALTLLPTLLYQLRYRTKERGSPDTAEAQEVSEGRGTSSAGHARMNAAVLRALASLAVQPACTQPVLGSLGALVSKTAPPRLQAYALRLLALVWQHNGRCFQQLKAALVADEGRGVEDSCEVRLAKAACLRDVCRHHPERALELVLLIQACLGDALAGVVALGLECLTLLCAADFIDFYTAWRVVRRIIPTVPKAPVAARQWVAFLSCGAMDARVHEEASRALVGQLWGCRDAADPSVRQAAYTALATFRVSLLEELLSEEVPLGRYAELYLQEAQAGPAAAQAASAAKSLLEDALGLEHSRRRTARLRMANTARSIESSVIPAVANLRKRLQGMYSGTGKAASTMPAGTQLICTPFIGEGELRGGGDDGCGGKRELAEAKKAAAAAAAAYRAGFKELAGRVTGSDWNYYLLAGSSWEVYVTRWARAEARSHAAAAREAAQGKAADSGDAGSAMAHAVGTVWGVLNKHLNDQTSELPLVGENAMIAAAALCGSDPKERGAALGSTAASIVEVLRRCFAEATTDSRLRAAAMALATASPHVAGAAAVTAQALAAHLSSAAASGPYRPGGVALSGCGEALGLLCLHEVRAEAEEGACVRVAAVTLHSLLGLIGRFCPHLRPQLHQVAAATSIRGADVALQWDSMPPATNVPDEGCALLGALLGLGHVSRIGGRLGGRAFAAALLSLLQALLPRASPAAGAASATLPDSLFDWEDPVSASSNPLGEGARNALQAGACAALPGVLVAAYGLGAASDDDILRHVAQLQGLVEEAGSEARPRQVFGAVCAAAGGLLDGALACGLHAPRAVVTGLAAALSRAASADLPAPHRSAAALGLANLLGAQAGLPGMLWTGTAASGAAAEAPAEGGEAAAALVKAPLLWEEGLAELAKGALRTLEAMSAPAPGEDAKTLRTCSWALALLWQGWKFRAASACAGPESAEAGAAGATGRDAPAEAGGAVSTLLLRLQAASSGDASSTASSPRGSGSDMAEVAAAAEGLAMAARLPALNWSGTCRRALREGPDAARCAVLHLAGAHLRQQTALAQLLEEILEPLHF
ncbi:hypothetical protein CYMTET_43494, partial [Cymbomonas tetramitiformis]